MKNTQYLINTVFLVLSLFFPVFSFSTMYLINTEVLKSIDKDHCQNITTRNTSNKALIDFAEYFFDSKGTHYNTIIKSLNALFDPANRFENKDDLTNQGSTVLGNSYGYSYEPNSLSYWFFLRDVVFLNVKNKKILDIGSGVGQYMMPVILSDIDNVTIDMLELPVQLPSLKKQVGEKLKVYLGNEKSKIQHRFIEGDIALPHIESDKSTSGTYNIINFQKVLHFLSPKQAIQSIKNIYDLIDASGVLHLSVLTPYKEDEHLGARVHDIMNTNSIQSFPGYVQYEEKITVDTYGSITGKKLTYVKAADEGDGFPNMLQDYGSYPSVTSKRKMHYFTLESLERLLEGYFQIKYAFVIEPNNDNSDAYLSVVAIPQKTK